MLLKIKTIILFLSLSNLSLLGQGIDSVFNIEVGLSLNLPIDKDLNTKHFIGYGGAIYLIKNNNKRIKLAFGVEYNHFKKFEKEVNNISSRQNYRDITSSINYITIPVNARVKIDTKELFFVSAGINLNLSLQSHSTGTVTTTPSFGFGTTTSSFNDKFYDDNYFGISVGIGSKIKIARKKITLKSEYRFSPRIYDTVYIRREYFILSLVLQL